MLLNIVVRGALCLYLALKTQNIKSVCVCVCVCVCVYRENDKGS